MLILLIIVIILNIKMGEITTQFFDEDVTNNNHINQKS